uniref:Importin 13 n=1 Tax=Iconisemion striatum TaxID=60296 RepID=A0A1A7X0H1_9TELE
MQALGFLLSSLPQEEILGRLLSLISPHIQQLGSLVQQEANPTNKQNIVHILGMLSSLFSTLDTSRCSVGSEGAGSPTLTPNPAVVVLQQVFALVQNILSRWLHDSEVVEAVCGVFDKSLRTLLHDFGPMVVHLSEMLGQIYSAFPQASALDLTRQLVHIFAGEERHISNIRSLVEALTSTTLSIFQQDPRGHPDVAESFMHLHTQILKRSPDLYQSDQLDVKALFFCGILSMNFPETPTVKAACFFFTEFVSRCKDMPALDEVLQRDGKLLTETLLQVIGGGSTSSLVEQFSDVLLGLNRLCPSRLCEWMNESLQAPGFPSAHVTSEQKHTFTQQILREQTNKRGVKESVKEFSLLCRGLQGSGVSEY